MVSLLYTCPATHRRVPTGIETDAESLRASWSTRLTIHCSQCGKPHEFSVLETFIAGASDDENAKAWMAATDQYGAIEGTWSSRWNGGADPTIPGDAANKWKQGQAEVKGAGDRLYLLFNWDNGARRGLIDAHRQGTRLVGKYINLTDPKVTRPWIGLIVSNQRIDGRWTGGRLDFRR